MDEGRGFRGRHIISTSDLSTGDYTAILNRARRFKYKSGEGIRKTFYGQSMALLFYEPSTRTFSTFKEAIRRFGGRADHEITSTGATSVKKGESMKNNVKQYLNLGVDVIVLRHPMDGSARWAADVADKYARMYGEEYPTVIINGGDGRHQHPTQAIGDVFTIRDELGEKDENGKWRGKVDELTLGRELDFMVFGDVRYGRAAKSCIEAAHKIFRIGNLYLACHPLVAPDEEMVGAYRNSGIKNVSVVHRPEDFAELLNGNVDVAYGARIQAERQGKGTSDGDKKLEEIYSSGIALEEGMVSSPREHMIVMHPQPFDQNHPVIMDDELEDQPYAKWDPQAINHVFTRAGILELVLKGDDL